LRERGALDQRKGLIDKEMDSLTGQKGSL
jgi:hypothetical protein